MATIRGKPMVTYILYRAILLVALILWPLVGLHWAGLVLSLGWGLTALFGPKKKDSG